MNIFWGSKILTDTLLVTWAILSCYFFWEAFFGNLKKYNAVLFGIFSAFGFLSRYSMIWFFIIFFVSLLFKYKHLKFLYEKNLWISITSFFVLVGPWFVYNYFTYGSWLGFLVQANEASMRWGGRSFFLYFSYLFKNFWITLPLIFLGILKFRKKSANSFIFVFSWFFLLFVSLSLMAHKEERYFLILLPPICLLTSFGILKLKKYKKLIFVSLVAFFIFMNFSPFLNWVYSYDSPEQTCFFETMDFIQSSNASYIVTEHFSPVYFYTFKPNIRVGNYSTIKLIIDFYYPNETIFYYYVEGDWFNLIEENKSLGDNLVFSCNTFKLFNISR